jgi:hypothetical protein
MYVYLCFANTYSFNAAYDALGGRSTKEIQRGLEISMALQTAVRTTASFSAHTCVVVREVVHAIVSRCTLVAEHSIDDKNTVLRPLP